MPRKKLKLSRSITARRSWFRRTSRSWFRKTRRNKLRTTRRNEFRTTRRNKFWTTMRNKFWTTRRNKFRTTRRNKFRTTRRNKFRKTSFLYNKMKTPCQRISSLRQIRNKFWRWFLRPINHKTTYVMTLKLISSSLPESFWAWIQSMNRKKMYGFLIIDTKNSDNIYCK